MSELKITVEIPAHTKTLTAIWCNRDFTVMSQSYRKIRAKTGNPMDACYVCSRDIADGEVVGLACFNQVGNKVLCQTCADELLASAKPTQP